MSTTDPNGQTAATRWRLDPADFSAEFRVPHFWGLITVKGHFDRLDGWLEIDHNGERTLELVIDAASLDTGNRRRDQHLRSADFFDTEHHPDVRFHSTSVSETAEGRLQVKGEFAAAGNQLILELEPTLQGTDDQLHIEASATIDQRQLGMTWSPLDHENPRHPESPRPATTGTVSTCTRRSFAYPRWT